MGQLNLNPFHVPHFKAAMIVPEGKTSNPDDLQNMRNAISPLPRSYEESFLCEAVPPWPVCAQGNDCEGLTISNVPSEERFILKAFFFPMEIANGLPTNTALRQTGRVCLLCKRREILFAFLNVVANAEGLSDKQTLADHYHMVDIEGEYDSEDTVNSSPEKYQGLLAPFLNHKRSKYSIRIQGGIRYYIQLYKKPGPDLRHGTDQRVDYTLPQNRDCLFPLSGIGRGRGRGRGGGPSSFGSRGGRDVRRGKSRTLDKETLNLSPHEQGF